MPFDASAHPPGAQGIPAGPRGNIALGMTGTDEQRIHDRFIAERGAQVINQFGELDPLLTRRVAYPEVGLHIGIDGWACLGAAPVLDTFISEGGGCTSAKGHSLVGIGFARSFRQRAVDDLVDVLWRYTHCTGVREQTLPKLLKSRVSPRRGVSHLLHLREAATISDRPPKKSSSAGRTSLSENAVVARRVV